MVDFCNIYAIGHYYILYFTLPLHCRWVGGFVAEGSAQGLVHLHAIFKQSSPALCNCVFPDLMTTAWPACKTYMMVPGCGTAGGIYKRLSSWQSLHKCAECLVMHYVIAPSSNSHTCWLCHIQLWMWQNFECVCLLIIGDGSWLSTVHCGSHLVYTSDISVMKFI